MTDSTTPILLYLVGGSELRLKDVEPKEWAAAFDRALARNEAIQLDDGSGRFGINPRAVVYWKAGPSPGEDQP